MASFGKSSTFLPCEEFWERSRSQRPERWQSVKGPVGADLSEAGPAEVDLALLLPVLRWQQHANHDDFAFHAQVHAGCGCAQNKSETGSSKAG